MTSGQGRPGGLVSSAAAAPPRPAPAHLVCNLPILVSEGGGGGLSEIIINSLTSEQ